MKLVNKEKFEAFLAIAGLAILMVVILVTPFKQPTTWDYYDALDEGMTWDEYMEVNR